MTCLFARSAGNRLVATPTIGIAANMLTTSDTILAANTVLIVGKCCLFPAVFVKSRSCFFLYCVLIESKFVAFRNARFFMSGFLFSCLDRKNKLICKYMQIPQQIKNILEKLDKAGFSAYIVGGCVRDLLMNVKPKDAQACGRAPKDWDITTNARPEQILKIFPNSEYENEFGTVLVKIDEAEREENLKCVEVTTYRSEQGYADRRHPDEIKFEDSLDKDLERRDFTINAMAIGKNDKNQITNNKQIPNSKFQIPNNWSLVDLFGGVKDIDKKIIRAVGEPADRFKEDALRMLRAIRFSVQLHFEIEPKTERAIAKLAGAIKFVSKERIHDELVKILQSDYPAEGILLLYKTKLLHYVIPELEIGIGVEQSKHHTYTVFKHSVESLRHTQSADYRVRMASLLHDIAKPQTKKFINGVATFYNHEYAGARLAKKIMQRLKFSSDDVEKVTTLVRNHMFYYNVDEVTAASVRRLLKKVGRENLQDLIALRVADRLGSGTPKAMPYKLRHLQYMFKKVQNDTVSVKMLAINGDDLMPLLGIAPGPKIGAILDVLLSDVIDEPKRNTKAYLEKRSRELNELNLEQLRAAAREKITATRAAEDEEMKKEFWVK